MNSVFCSLNSMPWMLKRPGIKLSEKDWNNRMNKKYWWAFLILLILLGVGGYWAFHNKRRGRMESLTTIQASQGSIEDLIQATGNVAPLNRVAIQAPIAGRIQDLLVDEGDKVHGGQILAWMSSTDRAA